MERSATLRLIRNAVKAGARRAKACEALGLSLRTVQRWERLGPAGGGDRRSGPKSAPLNKLSEEERREVFRIVNSPEYRDLSPRQIVPRLADRGVYVASESTIYRLLKSEGQLVHREPSRPRTHSKPREQHATGPNQVWSWDITYVRGPVRGAFFYAYLVVDVWSRKVVGWEVAEREDQIIASLLIDRACAAQGIQRGQLTLHSDNGGPMKGSTMLATLRQLGVVPSFSRPKVSDDNPFSEALFRTLKYRPGYPRRGFASLAAARAWFDGFVRWYNDEHRHSAIRFVTPTQRHDGQEAELLRQRAAVYEAARRRHPKRWTSSTRNWTPAGDVYLNPVDPQEHVGRRAG